MMGGGAGVLGLITAKLLPSYGMGLRLHLIIILLLAWPGGARAGT